MCEWFTSWRPKWGMGYQADFISSIALEMQHVILTFGKQKAANMRKGRLSNRDQCLSEGFLRIYKGVGICEQPFGNWYSKTCVICCPFTTIAELAVCRRDLFWHLSLLRLSSHFSQLLFRVDIWLAIHWYFWRGEFDVKDWDELRKLITAVLELNS